MKTIALFFLLIGAPLSAVELAADNAKTPAAGVELRLAWTLPSGSWIRCNPNGQIPVYETDPHALDQVTGRADSFIVMPGGIGIFLASGRSDFYYWQISRALISEFPDRNDLAALCGDGCPDSLITNLNSKASP